MDRIHLPEDYGECCECTIQKGASISFCTLMAVVNDSPFSSSKVDSQTRNCSSPIFVGLLEFYPNPIQLSWQFFSSTLLLQGPAYWAILYLLVEMLQTEWLTSVWFELFPLSWMTIQQQLKAASFLTMAVFHEIPKMILFINFNYCASSWKFNIMCSKFH